MGFVSEPAVNSLVKLKIPVYQVHAMNDESAPVEDAYIVPLEFARLKKNNLTFKVYANCNHSFVEFTSDGKEISHKREVMNDFFKWVGEHD